jgi:lysophospholipase L1-like esterase
MTRHYHTYLALGDSYTIGELVPLHESFPYQAVQHLRQKGLHIHAPEIVAKTGWTTFELAEHLLHTQLNEQYDFVTLLIGVNNQYRGLSTDDFKSDFEFLLKKAIHFAGHQADKVLVLSIPDWGLTPFAEGRDTATISKEIDHYNTLIQTVCKTYQVTYKDITVSQRQDVGDKDFVASDGLHPSGKEYAKWALATAAFILPKAG